MTTYTVKGVFKNLNGKHVIAKGIASRIVADSIVLKSISNGWWDVEVVEVHDTTEQQSEVSPA